MATINYKEKYEKAVRAAMLAKQDTESAVTIRILEEIFPELKESEDERIRKELIMMVKLSCTDGDDVDKKIAWLERQVEQKPAWSEEDEKQLNDAIDACKAKYGNMSYTADWLKSLKDRVQPQPKFDWGEEDEKMIGNIRSIIEKYAFSQSAVDVNGDLCEKEYIEADNWLKFLRPRNRWKPSDEQMEALK